ncbi:MAG: hypothetical protein CMJ18_23760 [Phycisphaeraceae bacterium]|nr:hypothetical protein [Phycisphaeraceae bacterium]
MGSAGDVHPFLGIGSVLRGRGHDVTVVTSEPFRAAAEKLDLAFRGAWTDEAFDRVIRDPDLWHARRGLKVILDVAGALLPDMHEAIAEVYESGAVLVGHSISFATRVFEEKHHAKGMTVHLSPNVFRSQHAQPVFGPGIDMSDWPRWVKRALWWFADRWMIDPKIAPALNRWRAGLGLGPVQRVFRDWIHSPHGLIGLFPDWFGAPQPDWPGHLQMTGFPLFDREEEQETGRALSQWLEHRPIVFMPGSANVQAEAFFSAAAGAVERLGCRALFMTPWREQCPKALPDGVLHVAYAPFDKVLPSCAAVVHHGGIGSCAQGMAAGIPQLIMPMSFDQPDNAARLKRLGVGEGLYPAKFTAERVAQVLDRLVSDDRVADRCRILRDRIVGADALSLTCDAIERSGETEPND